VPHISSTGSADIDAKGIKLGWCKAFKFLTAAGIMGCTAVGWAGRGAFVEWQRLKATDDGLAAATTVADKQSEVHYTQILTRLDDLDKRTGRIESMLDKILRPNLAKGN